MTPKVVVFSTSWLDSGEGALVIREYGTYAPKPFAGELPSEKLIVLVDDLGYLTVVLDLALPYKLVREVTNHYRESDVKVVHLDREKGEFNNDIFYIREYQRRREATALFE